ncbi:MAG: hypothetical protein ACRC33_22670 [Gemmataceae bacterium]
MADLITLGRAKEAIYETLTAAKEAVVTSLIRAASEQITAYCRRDFTQASYDDVLSGSDGDVLLLPQYPVLSVSRVSGSPRPVLRLQCRTASVQRASVRVTPTGLVLTTVASGVTSANTTVVWSVHPTLDAVAAAVRALGGWEAAVDGGWGSAAAADLLAGLGAGDCFARPAGLPLFTEELGGYEVDAARGWLVRTGDGQAAAGWDAERGRGPVWPEGTRNLRVVYEAGYGSVPADVQEACAQWTAAWYWQTQNMQNKNRDGFSAAIKRLLEPHRRHPVGG